MKTSVSISRRSCSAVASLAPFSVPRFAADDESVMPTVERRVTSPADEPDARGRRAEADQLRVDPRARREPLRADVQRLEQVRLAGAVRADDEDDPRLQAELEPGVRAEVAQRDRRDDQTRLSRRA